MFFFKFKHQQWGFHDGDGGNPVVRPGEQKTELFQWRILQEKGVLRVLLDRWNGGTSNHMPWGATGYFDVFCP
jgi:hypothetical protein